MVLTLSLGLKHHNHVEYWVELAQFLIQYDIYLLLRLNSCLQGKLLYYYISHFL